MTKPVGRPLRCPCGKVLATEVAALGGVELPLQVSTIDSFQEVTDAPERSMTVVGRVSVDLSELSKASNDHLCGVLERCREVSLDLLERVPAWIGETD